jgi:hypothetical protein
MSARPCQCCGNKKYTTRRYDFSGNVLWSVNYFEGIPGPSWFGKIVTCQACDANNVYVGGFRVSDGTEFWSICAYDLATGALVWRRDLLADILAAYITYTDQPVLQICIDENGHVVCLMSDTPASSTTVRHAFVTLDVDGSLISVKTVGPLSTLATITNFCINEDGDYHWTNNSRYVFEWLSPFTSAPVAHELGDIGVFGLRYFPGESPLYVSRAHRIRRIGGRDYIGMRQQPFSDGLGQLAWFRGKAQQAVPHANADVDLLSFAVGTNWLFVLDIVVDPDDNVITFGRGGLGGGMIGGFNQNRTLKHDENGVELWDLACPGQCGAVDEDGNIYSSAQASNGLVPSVQKRDPDGVMQWGHFHARGDYKGSTGAPWADRLIDVVGDMVIKSGNYRAVGGWGPALKSQDVDFTSDVCPPYGVYVPCTGQCRYEAANPVDTVIEHDAGSGTFTWPTNCALTIETWGPAAGGAAGVFGGEPGQGGGSGDYRKHGPAPFTPADLIHWAVGLPGLGAIAGDPDPSGGDAGDTTISGSVAMTAGGGKGGYGTGGTVKAGEAGIGMGGTAIISGNPGDMPLGPNGGDGGDGPTGALGGDGGASDNGDPGDAPGAGGGGGSRGDNGGDGAPGRVRFTVTTWDWVLVDDNCSDECDGCAAVDADFYVENEYPSSPIDEIEVDCE